MMTTVGLTGGIGSGKTTIANLFASQFSIPIYIADTNKISFGRTSLCRWKI